MTYTKVKCLCFGTVVKDGMATDPGAVYRAIWGRGPDDVYAVGEFGAINHFDGDTWSPMSTDIPGDYMGFDVWGTGSAAPRGPC